MLYCKVNDTEYPVIGFYGKMKDDEWDGRESKTIHLEMEYEQALELFVDDISWYIVTTSDTYPEAVTGTFDNSAFCLAGDITDHRDGTLSVKMGKLTDLEEAYEILYGGEE